MRSSRSYLIEAIVIRPSSRLDYSLYLFLFVNNMLLEIYSYIARNSDSAGEIDI